jgi:hypothetical protein
MNDLLDNRPRRIVRMAAEMVESPATKDWLWCDERGLWEQRVAELLTISEPVVKEKNLTPEQVDKEIATHLAYVALTAVLEQSKKERDRAAKVRADRRGRRTR